jgi:PAS domain S-box-containing protein
VSNGTKTRLARSIALSPDLAELARARSFVAEIAAEAGFAESRSFDIVLLASEAAANAIEHAPVKGIVEIKGVLYPDRLEIQVKGPGEFQTPDRLTKHHTRGLGLPLMAKLSDHLALYSAPEGGTLLTLTFYREGHHRARADSPLPPSLLEVFETSDRLEAVFEAMAEGFAIFDDGFRCVYLNEAMAAQAFEPQEKLVGYRISGAESGEGTFGEMFDAARATGGEVTREIRHPRQGRWSEVSVIPFAGGFAMVSRDITERRSSQEALRQRSLLLDLSSEAILAWELDGPIRYWNSGAEKLYGYKAEEAVGRVSHDLLKTVFPRSLAYVENALRRHGEWSGELLHTGSSGRSIAVEARFRVIDTGEGQLVLEINRDITERKQAEQTLRETTEALRLAERAARAGFWDWDVLTGALTWDEGLFDLLGLDPSREGASFEAWRRAVHPEDEPAASERIDLALRGRRPLVSEYRVILPDGSQRWIYAAGEGVYDPAGRPVRMLGYCVDITERKRAEAERDEIERRFVEARALEIGETYHSLEDPSQGAGRESEERFRALCERSPDAVVVVTPDGRAVSANPVACDMFQMSEAELIVGWWEAVTDPDDPRPARVFGQREQIGPYIGELNMRRKDGSVFPVEGWFTIFCARGGEVLTAMTMRDIAARKRAEEALRESEERYRALAEDNERLYRQQLDIAEKLQLALLNIPSEIGRVRVGHLYRSATEAARVGGDFYDVFEVKGGLVCMLVGDVAGHGIEAARTATLVKDVVHAFAHQSVRPQEVLRRTNALLVEKELPGFVTLFLGVLDSDTGELRYALAGHPSPLLRRANGEVHALGSGSAPLGVHPEATWRPGAEELEAGDLLLLYTDGVIEVRRNGEFFGEKRLQTLLKRKRISVERLPHLVIDQVLAFSGGDLKDDVAVLALSLTGEVGAARPKLPFVQEKLLQ